MASASDGKQGGQHQVPMVVHIDYDAKSHGDGGGMTTPAPLEYNNKKPAAAAQTKAGKAARIRKSPDAPKRFKSSYILFFMAKQATIKKELGEGAHISAMSKKSAELWKNLSPEERAEWEEKAAQDKARYNNEKMQYSGPWQVPWQRRKKDPSAPKRPMCAFLFFTQTKRSELQAANPTMKNTEVSRLLGDIWRTMTPEEKAPHLEFEMKARGEYKAALADWKKQVQDQHDAQKDMKQPEDQRVDDSPRRYDPHALNTNTTPTAGMMLNNYLMQQTFGIYGPSNAAAAPMPPSRTTGPALPPSLPVTGRPVVLGPSGVPLLPSQQPSFAPYQPQMMFDDEFDFVVGEDVEL